MSLIASLDYNMSAEDFNVTDYDPAKRKLFLQVNTVLAILGVILGVLSILLNLVFLVAVQFLKQSNSAYYRLIQSLSFADILASLTFIIVLWPTGPLAEIDDNEHYTLLSALPYVLRSAPWMFFTGYLLTLSCLTLNQYIAVCKPWKYTENIMKRLVGILLSVLWVISSFQVLVPLTVLLILYHHHDKQEATRILFLVSNIEIRVWLVVFLVTTLFNVVLGFVVFKKIKFLKLQRRFSSGMSQETHNIRMKEDAFVTVAMLLLASIFCRLPFPLMGIVYQNIQVNLSLEMSELIHAVLVLLLYINFFVDPLIYIFRMKDVQRVYKKFFVKYISCAGAVTVTPRTDPLQSTQMQLLRGKSEKRGSCCSTAGHVEAEPL